MADFLNTVKTTMGFSTEDTKGEEAMKSTIIDPTTGAEMQPTELTPNLDQNEEEGLKEIDLYGENSSFNNSGKPATLDLGESTKEGDMSTEDLTDDEFELKLEDLVGETNMSNIGRPCKRPGDMITVVPCTEHDVDFNAKKGYFVMDMYTIGKKTGTELADYIKAMPDTIGCIGEDDCSVSLEDAIERADKPEVILCPEEDGALHTTRSDRSCKSHPDNSCLGNIIRTLVMTYRMMKKATKRGIRDG